MKKYFSLLAVVMTLLTLVSCKKDYTCTCTIIGIQSTSTFENATKGDATDACESLEVSAKAFDPEASCTLD